MIEDAREDRVIGRGLVGHDAGHADAQVFLAEGVRTEWPRGARG